jgi:hypothetical protein
MSDNEVVSKDHGALERVSGLFTYGTVVAATYLLIGTLFFYSGKGKIFDGIGAPEGIAKQFSGTFIETVPGVDAAWTILGLLELLVFVVTVVSLVRLEFLPSRRKPILFAALGLAMFTFSILAIGENVTGQNEGVASLFLYAAGTGVLALVLRHLSPYGALDDGSPRG